MVAREALQSRLDLMPGQSDMTLTNMQVSGLIGFFTETEGGKDVVMVFLTTEGRAKFEERNARLEGQSEEFLSPLTSEEKLQLMNLLSKIAPEHGAHVDLEEKVVKSVGSSEGGGVSERSRNALLLLPGISCATMSRAQRHASPVCRAAPSTGMEVFAQWTSFSQPSSSQRR